MAVKRVKLDRLPSTNIYLASLLKKDPPTNPVMVSVDYQDAGKGLGDHQWHSRPGENLLMSLLLFPAFLSASQQFQLSRMASLAIIDTLKKLNLTSQIKWPNDILLNKKKLAGILIENGISGRFLSHTIIGIGLNLNQTEFPDFPLEASSVALESGIISDRSRVLDMLLDALMTRYGQLEKGDVSRLGKDYLEHLFLLDQPGIFTSGGQQFTGIIRGLSELGELVVEAEGMIRTYAFQEIQYLLGEKAV